MTNFIKSLTPEDTEEVKPGVFLQKRKKGWKQVYPAAWKGKINWGNFILGGPDFWKTTIWFMIILFLVFSYWHDTNELREFHDKVSANREAWCAGVPLDELEDYNNLGGVFNETGNTLRVQGDNGRGLPEDS